MSKFARFENNTVVEVFSVPDQFTLADCFHVEVAAQFSPCPESVTVGSTVDSKGKWTIAPTSVGNSAPEQPSVPKVSPVQFKLLFTVLERVAIKTSEDPIVKDFFEIVNDPRLTFVDLSLESTQQALAYLESKNLIGKGRPAQILTGIIQ